MMLKVISRIVQIKDRGRVLTSSEIYIILHITRKSNPITFQYYSFKITLTWKKAYLLFLPFYAEVRLVLRWTCEIFSPFSTKTTKLTQPFPQGYLLPSLFLVIPCIIDDMLPDIAYVFQIWSTLAGFEELAGGFEQIRNGEYFELYHWETLC